MVHEELEWTNQLESNWVLINSTIMFVLKAVIGCPRENDGNTEILPKLVSQWKQFKDKPRKSYTYWLYEVFRIEGDNK